jgi:asparagine synthetase B (glutamine-hydrolysing)
VHAWEEWGAECVTRLRGIFAFGLWDQRAKTLFLARDPLGVKPLYYARYGGRLTFASQPKAILADPDFRREIDPQGLRDFLSFGYVSARAQRLRRDGQAAGRPHRHAARATRCGSPATGGSTTGRISTIPPRR